MPEERVKVMVVGPPKVGKTCVANFLSNTRDTPTAEYKETAPLRILEAELSGLTVGGRRLGPGTKVVVELWDVGANMRFQACWPAIFKDAHAIIFVMNPEIKSQEKELEMWFKNFAVPANISDEFCLVFAHHSTPPAEAIGARARPQMPGVLRNAKVLETSLDFQSDSFKSEFDHLVERVLHARRQAEEEALLRTANEGMPSGPLLGAATN
jgi:hypothetical protein